MLQFAIRFSLLNTRVLLLLLLLLASSLTHGIAARHVCEASRADTSSQWRLVDHKHKHGHRGASGRFRERFSSLLYFNLNPNASLFLFFSLSPSVSCFRCNTLDGLHWNCTCIFDDEEEDKKRTDGLMLVWLARQSGRERRREGASKRHDWRLASREADLL